VHDKNGTPIKVGDRVTVEFQVKDTSAAEDYCNVFVETVEPFWPDANRRDSQWINAKQCVLVPAGINDAPRADDPMLRWFAYAHLPEKLRAVSEPFGVLAHRIVDTLPQCAERTVALRKLLEAKDAAVRAALSAE
jgi:hypothetical protein